jgi:hypothetical protein
VVIHLWFSSSNDIVWTPTTNASNWRPCIFGMKILEKIWLFALLWIGVWFLPFGNLKTRIFHSTFFLGSYYIGKGIHRWSRPGYFLLIQGNNRLRKRPGRTSRTLGKLIRDSHHNGIQWMPIMEVTLLISVGKFLTEKSTTN